MDDEELKSLRAADPSPPQVGIVDIKHNKMDKKVENDKEAKRKEGISWCGVFPYLVIVLLGLVLAYYAGNFGGKELDKACAINQTKWESCETDLKKMLAQAEAYEAIKIKFQNLETDCAVDRAKWADCQTKVKELSNDVDIYQRLTNRLDKDLVAKEKELTKLKVECVKKEVLLDVKDDKKKQDLEEKRDFKVDMENQKVVEGSLKQKVEDCEKKIEELKKENARLDKRIRQLVSPEGKKEQGNSNTTETENDTEGIV